MTKVYFKLFLIILEEAQIRILLLMVFVIWLFNKSNLQSEICLNTHPTQVSLIHVWLTLNGSFIGKQPNLKINKTIYINCQIKNNFTPLWVLHVLEFHWSSPKKRLVEGGPSLSGPTAQNTNEKRSGCHIKPLSKCNYIITTILNNFFIYLKSLVKLLDGGCWSKKHCYWWS